MANYAPLTEEDNSPSRWLFLRHAVAAAAARRRSCRAGDALLLDPGQGLVEGPAEAPVHLGDLLPGGHQGRTEGDAVDDGADDEPVLLGPFHAVGGDGEGGIEGLPAGAVAHQLDRADHADGARVAYQRVGGE